MCIQLPLSLGSDPGSALITGNVWVLKCQGSGELILDQRLRRWLCNEPRWEASDEEFPWRKALLRLQKQRTAGNQEVQPEAVSCSLDCSISSHYLLITLLHCSAPTVSFATHKGGCWEKAVGGISMSTLAHQKFKYKWIWQIGFRASD